MLHARLDQIQFATEALHPYDDDDDCHWNYYFIIRSEHTHDTVLMHFFSFFQTFVFDVIVSVCLYFTHHTFSNVEAIKLNIQWYGSLKIIANVHIHPFSVSISSMLHTVLKVIWHIQTKWTFKWHLIQYYSECFIFNVFPKMLMVWQQLIKNWAINMQMCMRFH